MIESSKLRVVLETGMADEALFETAGKTATVPPDQTATVSSPIR